MFTKNTCLVHHCRNIALSTFDEDGNLTEEKSYCLDHIPDPGKAKDDIYKYIATHDKIIGLTACGLIFTDIDLTNKKFFGCNFYHCTFMNIHSENVLLKMCIFDFAVFNDCNFIKNKTTFSSFSGCTFTHTLFTSSDMVQNNFNGIQAVQSSFDNSDLFNSRFINATLIDTSFRNWMDGISASESKEEKVQAWKAELKVMLMRFGDDLLRGGSPRDYRGIVYEDGNSLPKVKNNATVYHSFMRNLNKHFV